MGDNGPEMPD
ncbi:Protein of unknown function [Bacillus mycoides]|nr:Protein of unknown function [Bacillus mycoides]